MIQTKEEFARIWKKNPADLNHLDHFTFLLINTIYTQLETEYFRQKLTLPQYQLSPDQISELVLQLGDGLHFFYEQMCFGKGCSLGCPNKLDLAFSKGEEAARQQIIKQEFDGDSKACRSRKDCLQHDLMNYVVKDNLLDFYNYSMNIVCTEDEPQIIHIAEYIVAIIMRFSSDNGSVYLKQPFKKTA